MEVLLVLGGILVGMFLHNRYFSQIDDLFDYIKQLRK
tara:strand:+ start:999 stop:1109 length:111 start_codon:yes stop_codon:yes gene_type:complete